MPREPVDPILASALASRAWESLVGHVARDRGLLRQYPCALLVDGGKDVLAALSAANDTAAAEVEQTLAARSLGLWRVDGQDALLLRFGAYTGYELYELAPGELWLTDCPWTDKKKEFRKLISLHYSRWGGIDIPSGLLVFTIIGEDLTAVARAVEDLERPGRTPLPTERAAWIGEHPCGCVIRTPAGRYDLSYVDDPRQDTTTSFRLRLVAT